MTVRTVEIKEAILDAFEEGPESIREIGQELNISKTSVHRVMTTERRHSYHYRRVQHLQPEDYLTTYSIFKSISGTIIYIP
jgi:DNA-binding IclR family transcriptional regulator